MKIETKAMNAYAYANKKYPKYKWVIDFEDALFRGWGTIGVMNKKTGEHRKGGYGQAFTDEPLRFLKDTIDDWASIMENSN